MRISKILKELIKRLTEEKDKLSYRITRIPMEEIATCGYRPNAETENFWRGEEDGLFDVIYNLENLLSDVKSHEGNADRECGYDMAVKDALMACADMMGGKNK